MDITANNATAAASRNPKAALTSLLEVINFYLTRNEFYFSKIVYNMLYKRNKKQIECTHLHHSKKNIDLEHK